MALAQLGWWIGMVSSVVSAIVSEGLITVEPYHKILLILLTVSGAVSGYMIQKPRREWTDDEREARTKPLDTFKE